MPLLTIHHKTVSPAGAISSTSMEVTTVVSDDQEMEAEVS
jgi:hypothetical protein